MSKTKANTASAAKETKTLQDVIKHDGIKAKGYGTIPKAITHDTDLTLESVAIYGYFCVLCGNGLTTFPSRDTILRDLQLSKHGYYKHYNALIEHGYITVEKANPADVKSHNIYTIVSNPQKLDYKNIDSHGYGILPRAVMIDDRLDIKAKGIYSYMASYAGAGGVAFPRKDNILYHLNISDKTYRRYYNQLIQYNYIIPIQRREKGSFGVCDYTLNQFPDEVIGNAIVRARKTKNSPSGKKQDITKPTIKPTKTTTKNTSPSGKKGDGTKGDGRKGDGTKGDTIINSVPINKSFINNDVSINQIPETQTFNNIPTETSTQIDSIDTNNIIEIVSNNISLPQLKEKYKENLDELEIINSLLIDVLAEKKPSFRVSGQDVPISEIKPVFETIEKKCVEYVIRSLNNNDNKFKIKGSVENYIRSCLFHAPRTITYYFDRNFTPAPKEKSKWEIALEQKIERDMQRMNADFTPEPPEPSFDDFVANNDWHNDDF